MAGSSALPASTSSGSPRHIIRAAAVKAIADGACPGVQIAVWANGRPLLSEGFGFANLETSSAVSPRSIFRIGSLTKQFTAAAVMRLADQGKLRVRDPVSQYLPAMTRLPAMTLLELMNHTAGLHADDDGGSASTAGARTKSQVQLANEIATQRKPLDFDPGSAWLYSNANYIVLGGVIEQVSGKPLRDALSSLVLEPLKLSSTAVDQSSEVVKERASGYTPNGGLSRFANADYIQISDAGGAGAMRSNARDLCAWHHALLAGQLLAPTSLKLMMTPGRLRDGRVSGANRFSPQDANYGDVQYACGLLVHTEASTGRVISHNGFINGFSAVLESYVDRQATFVVLCNSDVNPALPFRTVRRAVVQQLVS